METPFTFDSFSNPGFIIATIWTSYPALVSEAASFMTRVSCVHGFIRSMTIRFFLTRVDCVCDSEMVMSD